MNPPSCQKVIQPHFFKHVASKETWTVSPKIGFASVVTRSLQTTLATQKQHHHLSTFSSLEQDMEVAISMHFTGGFCCSHLTSF